MSAILCGKRSFFEDIAATSPPVTKRIRCSSSSPVRFSPPRSASVSNHSPFPAESHLIDQLAAIFPDMDKQVPFLSSIVISNYRSMFRSSN